MTRRSRRNKEDSGPKTYDDVLSYNMAIVESSEIKKIKEQYNVQSVEDLQTNFSSIEEYTKSLNLPTGKVLAEVAELINPEENLKQYFVVKSENDEYMMLFNGAENVFYNLSDNLKKIEDVSNIKIDGDTVMYLNIFRNFISPKTYSRISKFK